MIREVENLIVGHVNASIRLIVAEGFLARFESVLITSVDSTIDLSNSMIGDRIRSLSKTGKFVDRGVVVSGKLVAQIAATLDLFNGYDELWCFEQDADLPKPNDLWIVSPFNFETDPLPTQLSSWMASSHCCLGLGDGAGLNFVTSQRRIASLLQRLAE